MNILIKIDQKAAFAAGIDAPNSTELVEINPANLTQAERDYVAKNLDGNKLSGYYTSASLFFAELKEKIAKNVVEQKKRKAELAEKEAKFASELDDFIAKKETYTEKLYISMSENGVINNNKYGVVKVSFNVDVYKKMDIPAGLYNTDTAQRLNKYLAEIEKENENLIEDARLAHVDELKAKFADYIAEKESYIKRLDPVLLERHKNGYASNDEIERAIKSLILKDAGLPVFDHKLFNSGVDVTLSNEQYLQLKELQDKYKHAKVEAADMYYYRDAEDFEAGDEDGEISEDLGIGILVEWEQLNIDIKSFIKFS